MIEECPDKLLFAEEEKNRKFLDFLTPEASGNVGNNLHNSPSECFRSIVLNHMQEPIPITSLNSITALNIPS
jgi:hypothetical protein